MNNKDDWFALDKLYHIIFCFSLCLFFSLLSARTRLPFLRRYSTWIGSIISLSAGAGKEVADEVGFFHSSGASTKDAVSDLVGVLIALAYFSLCKCATRFDHRDTGRVRGVELI